MPPARTIRRDHRVRRQGITRRTSAAARSTSRGSCIFRSEAYLIENGKNRPVKGACYRQRPRCATRVDGRNDLTSPGLGTSADGHRSGGVVQPTIRIDSLNCAALMLIYLASGDDLLSARATGIGLFRCRNTPARFYVKRPVNGFTAIGRCVALTCPVTSNEPTSCDRLRRAH